MPFSSVTNCFASATESLTLSNITYYIYETHTSWFCSDAFATCSNQRTSNVIGRQVFTLGYRRHAAMRSLMGNVLLMGTRTSRNSSVTACNDTAKLTSVSWPRRSIAGTTPQVLTVMRCFLWTAHTQTASVRPTTRIESNERNAHPRAQPPGSINTCNAVRTWR